jgi:hypothetical protein
MSSTGNEQNAVHERLIGNLASDLHPVRPLRPPVLRALIWLGFVAALGVALSLIADLTSVAHRLTAAFDLELALAGSVATAILAAIAAFQLSLPDRSRAWAWLPLPAALLWIGASGMGCLRTWLVPDTHAALLDESRDCLLFILAVSAPLSALLFVMLRRAYSLQPGLTAALAGLASASAAAALLNLFHPFDAAASDLAVHAFAVAVVVLATRSLGIRALRTENFSRSM